MNNFYTGIGKRKTSIAKVFLKEGNGTFQINQKTFDQFFGASKFERTLVKKPFVLLNLNNKYDVEAHVQGGGVTGQLDAIRLAISKALCTINHEYRPLLKQNYLLHQDARIKERRKYGLKKARKASQYSKR